MTIKPVEFRGNALDELRSFPESARRAAGFQIDRVQRGYDPEDWKAMLSVGKGVREIRVWVEVGTFRVIYLAKLEDAVYVLHCFQKKAQKTATSDIELARNRYRELMRAKS
ncbi:hypothetical protein GALL_111100 [mine drainage metagenome]|uniref:Protein containing DUF891 n=1 Tax=mine drainage metagenome TaxID=410659 RepID=A0A1J5SZ32_9ZZZZ